MQEYYNFLITQLAHIALITVPSGFSGITARSVSASAAVITSAKSKCITIFMLLMIIIIIINFVLNKLQVRFSYACR